MAREKRWPSRWWFWSVPILANVYLVLVCAVFWAVRSGVFTGVFTGRLRTFLHRAVAAFFLPAFFFIENAVEPLFKATDLGPGDELLAITLAVALWELAAVAVGLPSTNRWEGNRSCPLH